jgi:hypothetical protein
LISIIYTPAKEVRVDRDKPASIQRISTCMHTCMYEGRNHFATAVMVIYLLCDVRELIEHDVVVFVSSPPVCRLVWLLGKRLREHCAHCLDCSNVWRVLLVATQALSPAMNFRCPSDRRPPIIPCMLYRSMQFQQNECLVLTIEASVGTRQIE